MNSVRLGKQVFDKEIAALTAVRDALDSTFSQIVEIIVRCQGKIVLTGIGKSGHICRKIAATMSSLGTPSFYLHPAEAQHGDLGMLSEHDAVIAISYSGESDEVIRLLPNMRLIGVPIIAITSNPNSTLAKNCDILQLLPAFEEAGSMRLAPTSSTTAELAYGDALALAVANQYGFTKENFSLLHPAGALGKKLVLKVRDLMAGGEQNSVIGSSVLLQEAIIEMSQKQMGVVCIEDGKKHLEGIITDGDLRRALWRKSDIYNIFAREIMTNKPYTIWDGAMAVDALQMMKLHNINCLPALNEANLLVGTITINHLIRAGIMV